MTINDHKASPFPENGIPIHDQEINSSDKNISSHEDEDSENFMFYFFGVDTVLLKSLKRCDMPGMIDQCGKKIGNVKDGLAKKIKAGKAWTSGTQRTTKESKEDIEMCKRDGYFLASEAITHCTELGYEHISNYKNKIETGSGAYLGTSINDDEMDDALKDFPNGKPILESGGRIILSNELSIPRDNFSNDWARSYRKCTKYTKYGQLILAGTPENFRRWAKSKTCRQEVIGVPDGRVSVYIEHTENDEGGRRGYILNIFPQNKLCIGSTTVKDGTGYLIFPNGEYYHGGLKDGKRHGTGKVTCVDGRVIEGDFHDGFMHGKAKYFFDDGSFYEGEWSQGKKNGKGMYRTSNGDSYDGEFKNNKKHGQGKYTHASGCTYEGEWKNDEKHGQGKYTYADGSFFIGEWKNGVKDGEGEFTYASGDFYKGDFKDGKMHGKGKYTYQNSSYYDGEWKNGFMHGSGYFSNVDGGFYDGEFKRDKKSGVGQNHYGDGSFYKGEFENDKRNGRGIYTYADGSAYTGAWKDGQRHGIGEYKKADGNIVYYGKWTKGKL